MAAKKVIEKTLVTWFGEVKGGSDHDAKQTVWSSSRPSSFPSPTSHQPLPLDWSIAMPYDFVSISDFLHLYLELLLDWLQLRSFICSTKRVSHLLRRYQIPLFHARLGIFSRSPKSTCKPSPTPSQQSSGLPFREEINQNLTLSICWL